MKRSISVSLFVIALLMLARSSESKAQSNASPASKHETASDELINEVRQLRIAVQQLGVNSYRGQVLVERLRLQQEQVNRLSQELNGTRNRIADLRSEQITIKTKLDEADKQREAGVVSDVLTSRYKEMLENQRRAEDRLVERESQLSTELEKEKNNLSELNSRLDALEREMIIKSQSFEKQKLERR
jgi:chromosome segregation ATPase